MQKIDLYQPIVHHKTDRAPLTLRVGVPTNSGYTEGGTVSEFLKPETYILLSALPSELQERVKTAVQAIISGM